MGDREAPLISTRLQVKPVVPRIKPVSTGSLHTKAVKTASRRFSTIITGLKPGANENFPPCSKIEMHRSAGQRKSKEPGRKSVILCQKFANDFHRPFFRNLSVIHLPGQVL